MKKAIFTLYLFFCWHLLLAQVTKSKENLIAYVNPFIGTGGHGHTYPGPSYPFGMIQPGPDTRLSGWDGCSGYHFTDSVVYGFSQTHLSGTGIEDYCDFLIMPTIGKPQFKKEDYASEFSKANEIASPGYYRTVLNKYNIEAEITTGKRSGLYQFTFPTSKEANVIIDLKHRDKVLESWVEIINNREIKGYRKSNAWAKAQELYFHIKFEKPFLDAGIAIDDQLIADKKAKGKNIKLFVRFHTIKKEKIKAQVAISAVDADGALKNLKSEENGFNFQKMLQEVQMAWNKELSKIQISDESDRDKLTVFYSALYHSFLNPNLYMDVDRRYRGLDQQIHLAKDFDYYTVFSLWDTFRTEKPLLSLIDKKRTLDFIKTFLAMYKQQKMLPIWPLASEETFCMIGNHAIPVIVDAYAKGIRDFDLNLALEAMKTSVNRKQFGLDYYAANGLVTADFEHESASKTVEYAYDDWCIAQFAKYLGKEDDYNLYSQRAQYWKNVYDPISKHIRARNNGGWWKPFDATEVNNNYTEGNSWHYSFSTQQDINSHIEFMGGVIPYERKLDELFSTSALLSGRDQSDITGLIGQYAHGNEPSHHMAYLFNFTHRPDKTQYYVQKILNEQYANRPDGLSGNEDCGQMSAWLVMSAMGIYPISPGNNMYNVGSPWFKEMRVNLENGKQIIYSAPNYTKDKYFINAIKINGQAYKKLFINYEQIENGAQIQYDVQEKPDLNSLRAMEKPVMKIASLQIVPNPIIDGPSESFSQKSYVSISNALPDVRIYYTTDGTEPNQQSKHYQYPIEINDTYTIKAIAFDSNNHSSFISTANFKKIDNTYKIQVLSEINKSYTGGGPNALLDGLNGQLNWRIGNRWQGFWGTDFIAELDLGATIPVKSVHLNSLQDTQAWIIFPPETIFYVAGEDKKFREVSRILAPAKPEDYNVQIREIIGKINSKARFIKIVAKNYGVLPAWHEGSGGLAHSFFDEIKITR